jgi:hypothetical protein
MFPISKIVMSIYCGGICASSINGIIEHNLKLEKLKSLGTNINYADYAFESFGGLMIGGFTGIWWPATLIGRVALMFSPTEEKNVKKQETQINNKIIYY